MGNVSDKSWRYNQNTHLVFSVCLFVCFFFENQVVYEEMWKSICRARVKPHCVSHWTIDKYGLLSFFSIVLCLLPPSFPSFVNLSFGLPTLFLVYPQIMSDIFQIFIYETFRWILLLSTQNLCILMIKFSYNFSAFRPCPLSWCI